MYARYLTTIAAALRSHVRAEVEGKAANIVDECVSALAALANALDPGREPGADPVAAWLAAGPAECPAVHRDVAEANAACAAELISGASPGAPDIRRALAREAADGRAALARMATLIALPPARAEDMRLGIDPARVERFLREATGNGSLALADFRPVLGGRSRQTALFRISGDDRLPRELVVQRQTPGLDNGPAFGGTATEYAVLETLHAAGMSVPRVLFMGVDPATMGAPFMIMERTRGAPVTPDFWSVPSNARYAAEMARQMAILHAHPPGKLAAMLPHPRARSDEAGWLAEIDVLANRLIGDAHGPSIAVAAAVAWLRDHVAGIGNAEAIVHNDFMFHNILADDGRITGVLDWEQVALGHPAEDLGYCYPVIAAMGAWDAFLAAYAGGGGRALTQQEIDFFALRAILRLMVLVYDGRRAFESERTDEVVVAGAGAGFIQRLHQRLCDVLADVLDRN